MSNGLPHFIVETRFFGDYWENCWTDENGLPSVFATSAEAHAEIMDIIESTEAAVSAGDMLSAFFPDDFRIVEVDCD